MSSGGPPARCFTPCHATGFGQFTHPANIGLAFGDRNNPARIHQIKRMGSFKPEAAAIISDLHWLVHQGHVIEFANGTLETAKKPLPRPVKAEKPGKPVTEATPSAAESATTEIVSAENVAETLAAETPAAPLETEPVSAPVPSEAAPADAGQPVA